MTLIKTFYTKFLNIFKTNAVSSQDSDDDDDIWFRNAAIIHAFEFSYGFIPSNNWNNA